MSASIPRWATRAALIGVVTVGFNYWLHNDVLSVSAHHPNRYAVVQEFSGGQTYTGVQGNIYVGDPYPNAP